MSGDSATTSALPTGQISLNEIHIEAGGVTGTQCGINDADIRAIIGKGDATQMGFNEWQGASAEVPLSFVYLGSVINATSSFFSGSVNGSTVTADDTIVVCGGVEGSGTSDQTYTLNSNNCTHHARTPMSSADQTSVYVGSRAASGNLIGDSTLTVAQTTNSGGFRGGAAAFRLVDGNRGSTALQSKTTAKGSGSPISLQMTATTDDIIFISAYTDFGTTSSIQITTSTGSVSTYAGVDNSLGSGRFAVITGASNPSITLTNTTGGSSPKCAIAATVFGYA